MSAEPFVPDTRSLSALTSAAQACEGCELFRRATRTVFGEGPKRARGMLIGEQPGNEEDLAGRPFIGPAGRLLFEAAAEAGLDRDDVYVTNAVKHFKWEPKGTRRLHKKPAAREITACRPWLDAELAAVAPEWIVCLGATAAQALLGRSFRITKQRGLWHEIDGIGPILATWHPSAILRAPKPEQRVAMREELVRDLNCAAMRSSCRQ